MRVLLDENLPHDLIVLLTGHSVSTVQGLGWSGIKNGDLLKRAGEMTDALVTMDGNIEHQQDVSGLPFGVVVVRAASNRVPDLMPLVSEILAALQRVGPGKVEHVGRFGRIRQDLKKT